MALNLVQHDAAGNPTCRTFSDSSIDVGGIEAGKFGQKALPIASIATGTDLAQITSSQSTSVIFNSGTVSAFTGMDQGFALSSIGTGAVVTPYAGVYRFTLTATVAANEADIGNYDQNSTYQAQLRTSSSLVYASVQLDMTDVNATTAGGAGSEGSAGISRSGSFAKVLAAGVNVRGLVKLLSGGGGHYMSAFVADVEYLGPGTQTI